MTSCYLKHLCADPTSKYSHILSCWLVVRPPTWGFCRDAAQPVTGSLHFGLTAKAAHLLTRPCVRAPPEPGPLPAAVGVGRTHAWSLLVWLPVPWAPPSPGVLPQLGPVGWQEGRRTGESPGDRLEASARREGPAAAAAPSDSAWAWVSPSRPQEAAEGGPSRGPGGNCTVLGETDRQTPRQQQESRWEWAQAFLLPSSTLSSPTPALLLAVPHPPQSCAPSKRTLP